MSLTYEADKRPRKILKTSVPHFHPLKKLMATQNFAWNTLFLQRVFNGSGKRVEADCIKNV
jgi:hypothetical protein